MYIKIQVALTEMKVKSDMEDCMTQILGKLWYKERQQFIRAIYIAATLMSPSGGGRRHALTHWIGNTGR